MGKRAYVYDGTNWVDIAQTATDMTGYVLKSGDSMTGDLSSTGKITDSLPAPVKTFNISGGGTNVMSVTSTTFANVSTTDAGLISVSLTTPYSVNCILTIGAWLVGTPNTDSNSLRVGTTATGATTWSAGNSPNGWGASTLYITGISCNGYAQSHSSTTHVTLNAGTTVITMQAYRSAATLTSTISFPLIALTPISWA